MLSVSRNLCNGIGTVTAKTNDGTLSDSSSFDIVRKMYSQ